jgi:hypothetical protein
MILFIFLVIAAIILYVNAYWLYIKIALPKASINDICQIAKTGDVILFKIYNIPSFYHHILTYSHVGIIVVHPITKEKYIIETHQTLPKTELSLYHTSSYLTDGIHIYNLYNRLSQKPAYEYRLFHLQLKNKYIPDDNKVVKFINNLPAYMKKVPYYYDYEKYIWKNCVPNIICNQCFGFEEKSQLFCSEFVVYVLKLTGVLNDDFDHRCALPGDFRFIKNNGETLYENMTMVKNI